MSRKDYELIAAGFREAEAHTQRVLIDAAKVASRMHGIRCAAVFMADQLETTNPRFDRERFLAAASLAAA